MKQLGHILLVEDRPMNIDSTTEAFRESDIQNSIYAVQDGIRTVYNLFGHGKFFDRSKYPMPALMYYDLKMIYVDDDERLHQSKNNPTLHQPTVILSTSSLEEADMIRSNDEGANRFLYEPVGDHQVLNLIKFIDVNWFKLNFSPR